MGVYNCSVNKGRIIIPSRVYKRFDEQIFDVIQTSDEDFGFKYLVLNPSKNGSFQIEEKTHRLQLGKVNLDYLLENDSKQNVVVIDYMDHLEIIAQKDKKKYLPQQLIPQYP